MEKGGDLRFVKSALDEKAQRGSTG